MTACIASIGKNADADYYMLKLAENLMALGDFETSERIQIALKHGNYQDAAKAAADATTSYYVNEFDVPGIIFNPTDLFDGALPHGLQVAQLDQNGNPNPVVESFRRVIIGEHPLTGEPLRQNQGKRKRQTDGSIGENRGFDLTFSAERTISLMHAHAVTQELTEVQKIIETATLEANAEALRWLYGRINYSRTGKRGINKIDADLFAVSFFQKDARPTSMPAARAKELGLLQLGLGRLEEDAGKQTYHMVGDPHLHVQNLIANVARCADGKFRTLDAELLYRYKSAAAARFSSAIINKLEARLGLKFVEVADHRRVKTMRVEGVDNATRALMSKRRTFFIEPKIPAPEEGEAPFAAKLRNKTARVGELGTLTRQSKDSNREPMIEAWDRQLTAMDFPGALILQKAKERLAALSLVEMNIEGEKIAVEESVLEALASEAWLNDGQLIAAAMTELNRRKLPVERVEKHIEAMVADGKIVKRSDEKIKGFVSAKQLRDERELLAIAKRSKTDMRHRVPENQFNEFLARQFAAGHNPRPEQVEALRNLALRGSIEGAQGAAGSGKTWVVVIHARLMREVFGYKTMATALGWLRSNELATDPEFDNSGFALAVLLANLDKEKRQTGRAQSLNNRSLLVIDEAGQICVADMLRLLKHCEDVGAQVVLTGDLLQTRPIGAGAAFELINREIGSIRLQQSVRMHTQRDRLIADFWSKGKTDKVDYAAAAIALMAERDIPLYVEQLMTKEPWDKPEREFEPRLQMKKGAVDTIKAAVDHWTALSNAQPAKTNLLLALTNEEVDALNREVRARLLADKILGETEFKIAASTRSGAGSLALREGDMIRFGVRNSRLGKIIGATRDDFKRDVIKDGDGEPARGPKALGRRKREQVGEHTVLNGTIGRVIHIEQGREKNSAILRVAIPAKDLSISLCKLDPLTGNERFDPPDWTVVEFDSADYKAGRNKQHAAPLSHAFARTIYDSQGLTVDAGTLVAMNGTEAYNKLLSYVGLSRARDGTFFFVNQKTVEQTLWDKIEQGESPERQLSDKALRAKLAKDLGKPADMVNAIDTLDVEFDLLQDLDRSLKVRAPHVPTFEQLHATGVPAPDVAPVPVDDQPKQKKKRIRKKKIKIKLVTGVDNTIEIKKARHRARKTKLLKTAAIDDIFIPTPVPPSDRLELGDEKRARYIARDAVARIAVHTQADGLIPIRSSVSRDVDLSDLVTRSEVGTTQVKLLQRFIPREIVAENPAGLLYAQVRKIDVEKFAKFAPKRVEDAAMQGIKIGDAIASLTPRSPALVSAQRDVLERLDRNLPVAFAIFAERARFASLNQMPMIAKKIGEIGGLIKDAEAGRRSLGSWGRERFEDFTAGMLVICSAYDNVLRAVEKLQLPIGFKRFTTNIIARISAKKEDHKIKSQPRVRKQPSDDSDEPKLTFRID